ncbi:hypothetical protein [Nostoc sp. 'Peltigera membranacea cyanobiont' 232]|uniref:hypothetical protein n=1 Tax=Nostoc sp. 'Peltigera membranacea cyanobiont' 232 TaxID=2014531 RepID=UPI000B95B545|nr:hypothetical protein [Nostoc sp. 'Peltigera membranacea cyanobiont' 232]OYE02946.1 hypothetical protein CDG79_20990 [Nostoc sp. 'Peltigera membranacea cyanobiont' 232]
MSGVRNWALIRQGLINGTSYNAEVNAHFGDTSADSGRNAAKNICLITSQDSMQVATQRQSFFYYQVLKIQNKPIIIGQPKTTYDSEVTYHPEISIEFRQDFIATPRGKQPKDARISWRLMGETSQSLTFTKINNAATLVFQKFFQNNIFNFNKGKVIGWYNSPTDGLHLQLYCIDSTEAERVAKYVVQAIDKTWNDNLFKTTTPKRNNLVTPEQITILGKQQDAPVWRPNITVKAYKAYMTVWGTENKVYELVGRLKNGQFVALTQHD